MHDACRRAALMCGIVGGLGVPRVRLQEDVPLNRGLPHRGGIALAAAGAAAAAAVAPPGLELPVW
eukprot:6031283-Amphidinium_carterae.1